MCIVLDTLLEQMFKNSHKFQPCSCTLKRFEWIWSRRFRTVPTRSRLIWDPNLGTANGGIPEALGKGFVIELNLQTTKPLKCLSDPIWSEEREWYHQNHGANVLHWRWRNCSNASTNLNGVSTKLSKLESKTFRCSMRRIRFQSSGILSHCLPIERTRRSMAKRFLNHTD